MMISGFEIVWILGLSLGVACLFGFIAQKLKFSPILGYLLSGYLIGPNGLRLVVNPGTAEQLANLGVTLLMFTVGLNLNWKDLFKVKRLAIPGAVALSCISILAGMYCSLFTGESYLSGLVIGFAICVSSTVVIVRVLTDQHLLQTKQGHMVVGWTIVEDFISIFGLILLPTLVPPALPEVPGEFYVSYQILTALIKVALFALFSYFFAEKFIGGALKIIARTRSHELFTLAIFSLVFLIGIGSSYLFGVSLALGAFLAGTIIGKTEVSHQAAANALPMRDAFAAIFFITVGMLFDPMAVKNAPVLFFGVLATILLLRPIAAFTFAKFANTTMQEAFTIALAIGQIGEYSFILAEEGNQLSLLPDNGFDVLVACAFISIGLNPLLFQAFGSCIHKKNDRKSFEESNESIEGMEGEELFSPKAVVVGFGPSGQKAAKYLAEQSYRVTVIDENVDMVSALKQTKIRAIFGDASRLQILEQAGIGNTEIAVLTMPEVSIVKTIIPLLQQMNPYIKIVARVRFRSDLKEFSFGDIPVACDEEASSDQLIGFLKKTLHSR